MQRLNPLTVVLTLSGVFFVLFLVISGVLFMTRGGGGSRSAVKAPGLFSGGSVGVVELNGAIMDSKKTLERLERMAENDGVKAVVLRLNSPGGAVAPSQEIYEAVKAFKKPLVVSMSSVAASGAYYIAMGAKKVYANPGTITGSIGVIMQFASLEKLYEWAKIKRYALKTGKYKDAGADYREMGGEERALLQGMIDDVLAQFKKAVADGRKLSMEQVDAVADGRIFSGAQAKRAKLVDELGTLQDAINDAAKQAGIKGKPNVLKPAQPRRKFIEMLFDDRDEEESEASAPGAGWITRAIRGLGESGSPIAAQLEALTPGVYWLWTGAR